MKVGCVFVFVAFVALVMGEASQGDSWLVTLAQGPVRGFRESGADYFTFHGIPYATAPTGPHKFKAPLPPPSWTEVLDANKNIICPQSPLLLQMSKHKQFTMTENCLIANVYVPDTRNTDIAVAVYIHGGGFQRGFGDMAYHKPLLQTAKVIVVNFNYRLGAHGFLCLGTDDAPGNAGLKDQIAALRWVKENIAKFGGNPNDITLAGFSAGAASVDLILLSGSARGLYNKVIPESGSANSPWAVQIDPIANAQYFASSRNFSNVDDIYALEDFYKAFPLETLYDDGYIARPDSTFVFVPCVERPTSEESLLIEAPFNLLKKSDLDNVPLLIGLTNNEGMLRLPQFAVWKNSMNERFHDFLPADLKFPNEETRLTIAKQIKEFYFEDKPVGESIEGFVDYFTDVLFTYPLLKSIRLLIKNKDLSMYTYKYSYVDEAKPSLFDFKGADHCAQSFALTESTLINVSQQISEEYKAVKEMMVELWINFITTGKPVTTTSPMYPSGWPAASFENHLSYMELNSKPQLSQELFQERFEFWESIYDKYRTLPMPPPSPEAPNAITKL